MLTREAVRAVIPFIALSFIFQIKMYENTDNHSPTDNVQQIRIGITGFMLS